MILASHGIIASSILQVDPDWLAYYNRVIAAGGSLSTTEQNATKTLVADLKANGLWTPMKAIYPMVGASAAACAQNLKSSSFTGTFTSGWTFASTGVTPNGTSAYMDTTFKPFTEGIGLNSFAFGVYCRNDVLSKVAFGATENAKNAYVLAKSSFGLYSGVNDNEGLVTPNWTDGRGFFINSRTASTEYALFQNTTKKTRTSNSVGVTDFKLFLGCYNSPAGAINFSAIEYAFNFISDGLTDTQASNFYTAVQAFQTTLSRNV
jgi:hypothetical protein